MANEKKWIAGIRYTKDKQGAKIVLEEDAFNEILKLSGSKAKSESGKRKAVRKLINEALHNFLEEQTNATVVEGPDKLP